MSRPTLRPEQGWRAHCPCLRAAQQEQELCAQVVMLLLHNQRAPCIHEALGQLRAHLQLFDCHHRPMPAAFRVRALSSPFRSRKRGGDAALHL